MDIQDIQDTIAAAFPDHELSGPQFPIDSQYHQFGGADPNKSEPRRIRLLVDKFVFADHAADPRFREALTSAIVFMRLQGGAIIECGPTGLGLAVREDDPHRKLPDQ